jgi:predicted kinase
MLRSNLTVFGVVLGIAAVAVMPTSASAYDGTVTGTLEYVYIKSNVSSQALMLELTGSPSLCGAGHGAQTFLAATATAFSAAVSVATAAMLAGRTVVLVSDWDAGQGICVLRQIKLQ